MTDNDNLTTDALPLAQQMRPTRRSKPRDAEATKDHILAAATAEFADKGLFGARVEEIASRTATSKHMIYYYFGSKDGLYSAVLQRAYAGFRTAEMAIDYEALDPLAALHSLAGNTFDAHVANPETVRILMSENLDMARHAKAIDHSQQRDLVLTTTQRILDRGLAQGLFRSDINAQSVHLMISSFSFFFVGNRHTFGTVFGMDMGDPEVIAAQRAEFIETMLCRCRV
jgi:AcrR family transcriptional regulator